jgi:CHAT domain/Calcineurin-like phosphoesterase
MIAQVLNRSFVLQQLSLVRKVLENVTSDRSTRDVSFIAPPDVDAEQLQEAHELIREAESRETQLSSGQRGFDTSSSRSAVNIEEDLDDRSFFSRDPIVSILQSVLEEYMIAHPEECAIQREKLIDSVGRGDFVVTDETAMEAGGSGPQRLLGEFEPGDPGWVSAAVAKGISLFRKKHAFNGQSATPPQIQDRARIILVGDWGTGLPRARKVANQIRKVLDQGGCEQHVIHLGDTYYSGFGREYETRFLPYWPVTLAESGRVGSWSLNGNHDMYSGGYGYYDTLLSDVRFKRQEKSSFFRLYNQYWNIFGLDTAWDDAHIADQRGVLKEPQAQWVMSALTNSHRKNVLLSHHQLFSVYDKQTLVVDPQLNLLLDTNSVNAWFWGHEHRCMMFRPFREVQYGRCLGNGGVPVYVAHPDDTTVQDPGAFEYRAYIKDGIEKWALFAFAVLEFDGPQLHVRYIDENGTLFYEEDVIVVPQNQSFRDAFGPEASSIQLESAGTTTRSAGVGAVGRGVAEEIISIARPSEETSVSRFPSIETVEKPIPGELVHVSIDLTLYPPANSTIGSQIKITDLPSGWSEIPVRVRLSSSEIDFDQDEGEVVVRRAEPSTPCVVPGTVKDTVEASVQIVANFFYQARYCGSAKLTEQVQVPRGAARALGADAAALPTPSPGEVTSSVVGSFQVDLGATPPDLTVRIVQPNGPTSGVLLWLLELSTRCRRLPGLPGMLRGQIDIGAEPAMFIRSMYATFEKTPKGQHVRAISGFGESLYDRSPDTFKLTYQVLRQNLGPSFCIQFITDEPYVPWELMKPPKLEGRTGQILAATHPIGRWISAYESTMPFRLPVGRIVTVAPDYTGRKFNGLPVRQLPQALAESEMLQKDFDARRVAGDVKSVVDLLENDSVGPVAMLHFAGHGTFDDKAPETSRILLQDGDLQVIEIRREEISLGKHYGTVVFLNACQVAAASSVLGSIGGWAEAFLREGFSAFIAPLWSVNDDDAKETVATFFREVVTNRRPPAEALQMVRATYGDRSPTYMSYLYYGDVMAKMSN